MYDKVRGVCDGESLKQLKAALATVAVPVKQLTTATLANFCSPSNCIVLWCWLIQSHGILRRNKCWTKLEASLTVKQVNQGESR